MAEGTVAPTNGTPGQTAPTATIGATPGAVPGTQTFDLKVDGKVIKVTQAQLQSYAQKGLFADKTLKSVDILKNTTNNLIEKLKTPDGLWEILNDPALGANPKAVFKKLMTSMQVDDELKDEMGAYLYNNDPRINKTLTPEQLEQRKKLEEYDRMKSEEQKRKEAEMTAQQRAKVQNIYQGVREAVTKQIINDKTFPQTEGAIRSVIEKLRVMNKQNIPVTPETIAKALELTKRDHLLHQQTMFDTITDPEELIKFFGEDRALKISRALIARLKSKTNTKQASEVKRDGKEKITDSIDKKYNRNRQGYQIMDI